VEQDCKRWLTDGAGGAAAAPAEGCDPAAKEACGPVVDLEHRRAPTPGDRPKDLCAARSSSFIPTPEQQELVVDAARDGRRVEQEMWQCGRTEQGIKEGQSRRGMWSGGGGGIWSDGRGRAIEHR
jgi:hypothetical protein